MNFNIKEAIEMARAQQLRNEELRADIERENTESYISAANQGRDLFESIGIPGLLRDVYAYLAESSQYPLEIVEDKGFVMIQRDPKSHDTYGTWEEVNIEATVCTESKEVITDFLSWKSEFEYAQKLRLKFGVCGLTDRGGRIFREKEIPLATPNVLQQVQESIIEAILKREHIFTVTEFDPEVRSTSSQPSYDW